MKDRYLVLKDIALGAGLALVASAGIVAAQVSTGPVKSARLDPGAVCCAVTAIDAKAGTITAKVTATGQTFTLEEVPAASLSGFKVGASLDLSCAVPPNSGTTGASGNAASSGSPTTATTSGGHCGSNVSRYANTKPVQPPRRPRPAGDCFAKSSSGSQVEVACPTGVPIKGAK